MARQPAGAQRVTVLHGMDGHPAEHGDASDDRPVVAAGIFNGGKAEQKGIELQVEWQVNDRFSLTSAAFLADPEFSEDLHAARPAVPSKKAGRCPIPRRRSSGPRSNTAARFLIQDGDFWTRFSYTYQGEFWNSLTISGAYNPIVDGEPWCPTADDIQDAQDQSCRRGPRRLCSSAFVQQRLGCRADRSQPVRRRWRGLSERRPITATSSAIHRFRYLRHSAAPADRQPLVHQEMVIGAGIA